jgi:ABC-type uncharacterized transport system substrate-binding protein
MMTKRFILTIFLMMVVLLVLTFPLCSAKGEPINGDKGPYKIYMVLRRGITEAEKGFMDYLVNKGLEMNFIIRDCRGDYSKLPGYIDEIRSLKPDLVYTFGTSITAAIAGRLGDIREGIFVRDIPVIFNIVSDPVNAGLIKDLNAPRRNITGISHLPPLLVRLERMKAVFQFKRLLVIYNPNELNSMIEMKQLEKLASFYQFRLIKSPLPMNIKMGLNQSQLPKDFVQWMAQKPDLVYLPADSTVINESDLIMELIDHYRIPSFSAVEGPIRKSGALMGLVGSYYRMGILAGEKAELILVKKKKPAKIPIRILPHYTFLVNKKSVKMLDIKISPKILPFVEYTGNCTSNPGGKEK